MVRARRLDTETSVLHLPRTDDQSMWESPWWPSLISFVFGTYHAVNRFPEWLYGVFDCVAAYPTIATSGPFGCAWEETESLSERHSAIVRSRGPRKPEIMGFGRRWRALPDT